MIRKIWLLTLAKRIRLITEYVGADEIIRSGADLLSRETVDDCSTLLAHVFEEERARLGTEPVIDLFASLHQRQGDLPYFVARPRDSQGPKCRGFDALSHPWVGHCYAFPPLHLVGVAVEKARSELQRDCNSVMLVVPYWTGARWWPLIYPFGPKPIGLSQNILKDPSPSESELWSKNIELAAVLLQK